jgi:hypothetical protein
LANLVFVTAIFFSGPLVAAESKAGLAKVVITPEEMTWLSGYGGRGAPLRPQWVPEKYNESSQLVETIEGDGDVV